jgi:DNA-binding MurR/RpiR family transcriptional regulator
MTASANTLQRRRERIVEMLRADPSRSSGSIARAVGCSTATVARQRQRFLIEPPADAREALDQGAKPAPFCRCDEPMPRGAARCLRCGRMVEVTG